MRVIGIYFQYFVGCGLISSGDCGEGLGSRLEVSGMRYGMFPFFYPSHTVSEVCTLAVIVSFEFMNHFP